MFPGVPIFFVMSGFLVAKSFMDNGGHLGRYFVNRALRIYPGLWLNLSAILLLMTLTGVLGGAVQPPVAWLEHYFPALYLTGSNELASATTAVEVFTFNNFLPFWPGGALWTIPIELGFYILLPVLLMPIIAGFRKAGLTMLALAAVGSLLYSRHSAIVSVPLGPGLINQTPILYLWIFLLGSIAHVVWRHIELFFRDRFWFWLAAYVAACLGLLWVLDVPVFCFYATPTAIGALKVTLLAGCVLSFAFSFAGASSFLRGVDLSYGIYLHHFPVICVFAGMGLTGLAWLPALVAVVLITAAASWFLIERPALELKAYRSRRFVDESRRVVVVGGIEVAVEQEIVLRID